MIHCERSRPLSLFHERRADMQNVEQNLSGINRVMTEGILLLFGYRNLCHFDAGLYSVCHVYVCEGCWRLFHFLSAFVTLTPSLSTARL